MHDQPPPEPARTAQSLVERFGGRRGPGAPKGNLYNFRLGNNSSRYANCVILLVMLPEYRDRWWALINMRGYPHIVQKRIALLEAARRTIETNPNLDWAIFDCIRSNLSHRNRAEIPDGESIYAQARRQFKRPRLGLAIDLACGIMLDDPRPYLPSRLVHLIAIAFSEANPDDYLAEAALKSARHRRWSLERGHGPGFKRLTW